MVCVVLYCALCVCVYVSACVLLTRKYSEIAKNKRKFQIGKGKLELATQLFTRKGGRGRGEGTVGEERRGIGRKRTVGKGLGEFFFNLTILPSISLGLFPQRVLNLFHASQGSTGGEPTCTRCYNYNCFHGHVLHVRAHSSHTCMYINEYTEFNYHLGYKHK